MKINKYAFGLAAGIILGAVVFVATNVLLISGAKGVHISLLGNFFFGYRYSFIGSIIGLFWGFVEGFLLGWLFALFHNLFVKTS